MSNKLQNILGISFFVILIALIIWVSLRHSTQNKLIDKNGGESIATINAKVKPYKGRKVLKYTYYVNAKKYKGTKSSISKYKSEVGDKFIVEYYVKDPKIHRLILSKPFIEKVKVDSFWMDSLFKEIDENRVPEPIQNW